MNLTALILTTALATGGDPCAPAAPACGCEASPGFFAKLRAKLGSRSSSCDTTCTPCGTPLFAGFTTACHEPADPCGKPGLLTRLKAKFQKGDACGGCGTASDCSAPVTACASMPAAPSGCALPIAPTPAPALTAEPPQIMPQPIPQPASPPAVSPEPPKAMPKPSADTTPKPMPKKLETSSEITIPSVPVIK